MNILLSIKPKYANEILAGRKKYEFRKAIFKRPDVERMYIYSCLPVGKIIGAYEIKNVIKGSPETIWEKCSKHAGISQEEFFLYFKNANVAYALELGEGNNFTPALDPFSIFDNFSPPQSFRYIADNIENNKAENI